MYKDVMLYSAGSTVAGLDSTGPQQGLQPGGLQHILLVLQQLSVF